MATKTFLSDEDFRAAQSRFVKPTQLGSGMSAWLNQKLMERLSELPSWIESEPILLGSWSRNELCPCSDIDMLFCGPEEAVQIFVGAAHSRGLRLRSRVPEDPKDWTVGVEFFDVLSLIGGHALNERTGRLLKEQILHFENQKTPFLKIVVNEIVRDRAQRALRFNSVGSYLEPHLKMGPGGLRDLDQIQTLIKLLPQQLSDLGGHSKRLQEIKIEFLRIRQKCHLLSQSDFMVAQIQKELSEFFEYPSPVSFMKFYSQMTSEVALYADWVLELCQRQRNPKKILIRRLSSAGSALSALLDHPEFSMQMSVKESIPYFNSLPQGETLISFLKKVKSPVAITALFRSQLLDLFVPEMSGLRGLVQQDHYHRYTTDLHLQRCMETVVELKRRPRGLGDFRFLTHDWNEKDWKILLLTALFHDLGKGQGGGHAQKGAKLARIYLKRWSVSTEIIDQVAWLVENHLLLTSVAFKMNPHEPLTWNQLVDQGMNLERLRWLTVFSMVDIISTNPDAWSDWKKRLLLDVFRNFESQKAQGYLKFIESIESKSLRAMARDLDPVLTDSLPKIRLKEDLARARRGKRSLEPLVLKNRKGEIWVRFHSKVDQKGLFLKYVSQLFSIGCSIQMSSVSYLPGLGVYDWFRLKTGKSVLNISRQLDLVKDQIQVEPIHAKLKEITVVSRRNNEVILNLRGLDQKGLLVSAAQKLDQMGWAIKWAKVITWGQQVDDVFCVVVNPIDFDDKLQSLARSFGISEPSPLPELAGEKYR